MLVTVIVSVIWTAPTGIKVVINAYVMMVIIEMKIPNVFNVLEAVD